MKKCILITVLTALISHACFDAFSQDEKSVSSYKSLKSRSAGKETEQLLNEAESLKDKDVPAALERVQEALGIAIAGSDHRAEARAYLLLGEINASGSEWGLARENYSKVVKLIKPNPKTGASAEYSKAIRGLGIAEMELGNYSEALKNFQQGLEYEGKVNARNDLRLLISDVFLSMSAYAEASRILDQVEYGKLVDESFNIRVQNQKARINARTSSDFNADNLYDNSLKQTVSKKKIDVEEQQSLQKAKEEIVDVLHEQGRYADELSIREKSIQFNTNVGNYKEVTKDQLAMSSTYLDQGQNNKALQIVEDAARIADTLNDPKSKVAAYLALAKMYNQFGRSNEALNAYEKYSDAANDLEENLENRNFQKEQILKKQRDIEELSKYVSLSKSNEAYQLAVVARQRLIIYGLLFVILVIVVTSYYIYKNAMASKRANQLLALKSLRSQMNPHFIFNALNAVNHFIAQQDERTANRFLSEFSRLMRLVMEHSQEEFIPLTKELEILTLYLKLEHYRFREKFEYELNVDEQINAETVEVPPMLIQPYIENAVWHGLRYRETPGKLIVNFSIADGVLMVDVIDDGIGRKKSIELKTDNQKKHSSTGLRNIDERLKTLNAIYKYNYAVQITDGLEQIGTHVRVSMPVKKYSSYL